MITTTGPVNQGVLQVMTRGRQVPMKEITIFILRRQVQYRMAIKPDLFQEALDLSLQDVYNFITICMELQWEHLMYTKKTL